MKLLRVFPRRTSETPNDKDARFGAPGLLDEADEVHISVVFTYDLPRAEMLEKMWRQRCSNVKVGGPATGEKGMDFVPGLYLKAGNIITSRGCPNFCKFCDVWRRDGGTRELAIQDGWKVQDDNLLACSEKHIRSVFNMLWRQKEKSAFTGGFEALRFKTWHLDLIMQRIPKDMIFAYDTPEDYEPLVHVGKMLREVNLAFPYFHKSRAYVLIGFQKDTIMEAEKRIKQTIAAGFLPFPMLYRDYKGKCLSGWKQFQVKWNFPLKIIQEMKEKDVKRNTLFTITKKD